MTSQEKNTQSNQPQHTSNGESYYSFREIVKSMAKVHLLISEVCQRTGVTTDDERKKMFFDRIDQLHAKQADFLKEIYSQGKDKVLDRWEQYGVDINIDSELEKIVSEHNESTTISGIAQATSEISKVYEKLKQRTHHLPDNDLVQMLQTRQQNLSTQVASECAVMGDM